MQNNANVRAPIYRAHRAVIFAVAQLSFSDTCSIGVVISNIHLGNHNSNRTRVRTRKLSYRKDDRAMCPIYGCPDSFRESLSTPTATFPEIFNGLLFRSIL